MGEAHNEKTFEMMASPMNPNASSFFPSSTRRSPARGEEPFQQEQDEMVIVFENGSEGSERDLPTPTRTGPPRGILLLDELREIHRQRGRQLSPWARTEVFEEVRTAKDFWRVFADDEEAQGVLLAYNYMFPHVDDEADDKDQRRSWMRMATDDQPNGEEDDPNKENGSSAAGNHSADNDQQGRRRQVKLLHEVLQDVRRYIQMRMHPVQEKYLGSGPDQFDEAGSGFNLQTALGASRTRGALRLFHFFHPQPVESGMGEPISFTIILGPPPSASPSGSPLRRGAPARLGQPSPPRFGSRGPLATSSPSASAHRARRQRTLSASSSEEQTLPSSTGASAHAVS